MWWFDPSANYVLIVTFVGDTVSDIMKTIMKYHWEKCKFVWLCYFFKTYDEKNEVKGKVVFSMYSLFPIVLCCVQQLEAKTPMGQAWPNKFKV